MQWEIVAVDEETGEEKTLYLDAADLGEVHKAADASGMRVKSAIESNKSFVRFDQQLLVERVRKTKRFSVTKFEWTKLVGRVEKLEKKVTRLRKLRRSRLPTDVTGPSDPETTLDLDILFREFTSDIHSSMSARTLTLERVKFREDQTIRVFLLSYDLKKTESVLHSIVGAVVFRSLLRVSVDAGTSISRSTDYQFEFGWVGDQWKYVSGTCYVESHTCIPERPNFKSQVGDHRTLGAGWLKWLLEQPADRNGDGHPGE